MHILRGWGRAQPDLPGHPSLPFPHRPRRWDAESRKVAVAGQASHSVALPNRRLPSPTSYMSSVRWGGSNNCAATAWRRACNSKAARLRSGLHFLIVAARTFIKHRPRHPYPLHASPTPDSEKKKSTEAEAFLPLSDARKGMPGTHEPPATRLDESTLASGVEPRGVKHRGGTSWKGMFEV